MAVTLTQKEVRLLFGVLCVLMILSLLAGFIIGKINSANDCKDKVSILFENNKSGICKVLCNKTVLFNKPFENNIPNITLKDIQW